MNGYLASLVERTVGIGPLVEPRPRSTFEPPPLVRAEIERSEEIPGRKAQLKPKAPFDAEPAIPRTLTATLDHEVSEIAARGNPTKPQLDPEPTLLPLPSEMPQPDTAAFRERPSCLDEPALTETSVADLAKRLRNESADAHRARDDDESGPDGVAAMSPGPHQRTTRPRSASTLGGRRRELASRHNHEATETQPVVKVTIGRVEVRANFPPPSPKLPQSGAQRSALSLEDYLKSRNGGGR